MFSFPLLSLSPVLSSCRSAPLIWRRVRFGAELCHPCRHSWPVPVPRPGSRAALGCGLLPGWAWAGAGQDEGHVGKPGSAEPVAGQGRTVGRQRQTGLQICWGRDWQCWGADVDPGQWQGAGPWWRQGWPQRVMVVPSEPDKLSVMVPLLLSQHPFSLCHAQLTMSQGLCCRIQLVFLCTVINTSSHGMAAGNLSLYKTVPVLCRAKQKENKQGTVSGWLVKVPPQLKQAGDIPVAPEWGPALPAMQLSGSRGLGLYLISSWPVRNRPLWALCCWSIFKRCYCVDIVPSLL